jgi:hypothetical protein
VEKSSTIFPPHRGPLRRQASKFENVDSGLHPFAHRKSEITRMKTMKERTSPRLKKPDVSSPLQSGLQPASG